mmetsp:Transcript_16468/g.29239  ORF Transcript_16468/g.29239 Transcript_16468/m.29239 type:complete len:372 (-) Transcript_16468:153-1268(-)
MLTRRQSAQGGLRLPQQRREQRPTRSHQASQFYRKQLRHHHQNHSHHCHHRIGHHRSHHLHHLIDPSLPDLLLGHLKQQLQQLPVSYSLRHLHRLRRMLRQHHARLRHRLPRCAPSRSREPHRPRRPESQVEWERRRRVRVQRPEIRKTQRGSPGSRTSLAVSRPARRARRRSRMHPFPSSPERCQGLPPAQVNWMPRPRWRSQCSVCLLQAVPRPSHGLRRAQKARQVLGEEVTPRRARVSRACCPVAAGYRSGGSALDITRAALPPILCPSHWIRRRRSREVVWRLRALPDALSEGLRLRLGRGRWPPSRTLRRASSCHPKKADLGDEPAGSAMAMARRWCGARCRAEGEIAQCQEEPVWSASPVSAAP